MRVWVEEIAVESGTARARRPGMRVLLLVLASSLMPSFADAEPLHLATPPLSATARALVHQKMENDSKDMTELVWAVVLLDYGRTGQLARAIATEPRVARPTGADATELNAAFSPRFFDLQDQLRDRARRLADATVTHDAKLVARSFSAVIETCVMCHDAFLNDR